MAYNSCTTPVSPIATSIPSITEANVLKIAGFSDAVYHRKEGNERLKDEKDEEKREGRLFQEPAGNPIVLVKMLTGETPWNKASINEDSDYRTWEEEGAFEAEFEDLIPDDALKLIKKMLNTNPFERVKPIAIAGNDFFKRKFSNPAVYAEPS